MCDALSEGGRRCPGVHTVHTAEQNVLRRARRREQYLAKNGGLRLGHGRRPMDDDEVVARVVGTAMAAVTVLPGLGRPQVDSELPEVGPVSQRLVLPKIVISKDSLGSGVVGGGRPFNPVSGIIMAHDGLFRSLGWSNGQWLGDPDLVAVAQALAEAHSWLAPPAFDEAVAVVAVMAAACGEGVVLSGDVPSEALALSEHILLDVSTEPEEFLPEGAKEQVLVNRYERDPRNRARCIAVYGLQCWVCGKDYESVYGAVGRGLTVVHHTTPVSEMGEGYLVDPSKDLVPLCADCHLIAHRRNPPYTPNQVRAFLGMPAKESFVARAAA